MVFVAPDLLIVLQRILASFFAIPQPVSNAESETRRAVCVGALERRKKMLVEHAGEAEAFQEDPDCESWGDSLPGG